MMLNKKCVRWISNNRNNDLYLKIKLLPFIETKYLNVISLELRNKDICCEKGKNVFKLFKKYD